MKKINIKQIYRILGIFIALVYSIFNIYSTQFQMEWGEITTTGETWSTVNLENIYADPIVVATPQYQVTSQPYGIDSWVTNITSTSFRVRNSNQELNNADNIRTHYIVMEKGNWTLPNSAIKIQAGSTNTSKYGRAGGGNWACPTYGEIVDFNTTFDSTPIVISTRASDNNPSTWLSTFQTNPSNTNDVTTTQMCQGLSRSKAPATTFSNSEMIHWIAADEGFGFIGTTEFEILWNQRATGTSGSAWITGYGGGYPYTQAWDHSWTNAPNIILGSQTSMAGSDGSWPVIHTTGNSLVISMFVDEANERAHAAESGGGWAFSQSGSFGNTAPNNINLTITPTQTPRDTNVSINATVTDANGNQTITSVIATIKNETGDFFQNLTLTQQKENFKIISQDLETGIISVEGETSNGIIGESGKLTLQNNDQATITFTQTYNKNPVIIAIAASANNDNNPYIPKVHSINTTHATISLCRDAGATTCDNSYISETVNYVIFDIDKSNINPWIEVGKVNATTNGVASSFNFGKSFTNNPYIWALPQTNNVGGNNIGAHSWFVNIGTVGAQIVACDHAGTGDTCSGSATEEFGYVAIDISNNQIQNFASGTRTIGNSAWTTITYGQTFTNPSIFVMVNSENGGQDPAYPWARNVGATTADIRYCELDGVNDCDTHNGEVTNWFVVENGPIVLSGAGDDNEETKILSQVEYSNIFNQITHNITNININVSINNFNNLGSTLRANNNPGLQLELLTQGTIWENIGTITPSGTGNYQLSTTNSNILKSWENQLNRQLRVTPINIDYVSSTQKDEISWDEIIFEIDYIQSYSNWYSNFTNTSICGIYNISSLISSDSGGLSAQTNYSDKIFEISCGPKITLLNPINNQKYLTNGNMNFTYNIESLTTNNTCQFILNGVIQTTNLCSNGNHSINFNIPIGLNNWTINATDENNLSLIATPNLFYNLLNDNRKITKSISRVGNNQYQITNKIQNKVNISSDSTHQEIIPNNFNAGSYSIMYDFTNTTFGKYTGTIFGWDFLLPANSNSTYYYSTTGLNNYKAKDLFILSAK